MGERRCASTQCCSDSRVSQIEYYLNKSIYRFRPHLANSHSRIGWAQFTDSVIKLLSDKRKGLLIHFPFSSSSLSINGSLICLFRFIDIHSVDVFKSKAKSSNSSTKYPMLMYFDMGTTVEENAHIGLKRRSFLIFRLGTYLFRRILTMGKDSRFDRMRNSPSRLFIAWMMQGETMSECRDVSHIFRHLGDDDTFTDTLPESETNRSTIDENRFSRLGYLVIWFSLRSDR